MGIAVATIIVVLALLWARAAHRDRNRRAQLSSFFEDRGIAIIAIRRPSHITYGFPGYAVVFASKDQAEAFRQSKNYSDFLQTVERLHVADSSGSRPFDAGAAVSLVAEDRNASAT